MTKFATLAMASGLAVTAQAAVISQWTFEAQNLSPAIGTGTASYIGGTAASGNGEFATGFGGSGTFGWNTSSYPASGNNKTAGVRFSVSTALYQDISVSWRQRHSNSSANTTVLQYTIDGSAWIDAQTYTFTPAASGTGDTWYSRSFNFSSIAGVNNNANFAIRIVAAFDPTTGAYRASRSTSSYAASGTWRFDDVTLEGTLIPSPGSLVLAGMGLLFAAGRRR